MLMLSDKASASYRPRLHDPKTVLEYPKLPLSRSSDVIKWQAPLRRRQTGRQTDGQVGPLSGLVGDKFFLLDPPSKATLQ